MINEFLAHSRGRRILFCSPDTPLQDKPITIDED
jgi:hypothetical protein